MGRELVASFIAILFFFSTTSKDIYYSGERYGELERRYNGNGFHFNSCSPCFPYD